MRFEATVPIGRPISNTRAYVLDDYMQPVPVGVAGELLLGGAGLAHGYLGGARLTAQRFVPDPFGPPGSRLYRTGDRARWSAEGVLEFLGRFDQQVKIRGFRVEPGEVEAALANHPAVRTSAVLARGEVAGERHLVAYVTTDRATSVIAAELRQFLHERLPDYLVPSQFVLLDELPLTPNGKVDRHALPHLEVDARTAGSSDLSVPRTETERALAAIWRDVLGLDAVGRYDNFFELGGHSLLLIRLHDRLAPLTAGELTIVDLFRYPTIASLAGYLTQQGVTPPVVPDVSAPRLQGGQPRPRGALRGRTAARGQVKG
jgi:hypothetical protein